MTALAWAELAWRVAGVAVVGVGAVVTFVVLAVGQVIAQDNREAQRATWRAEEAEDEP